MTSSSTNELCGLNAGPYIGAGLCLSGVKDPFHHCTDASSSGLGAALVQADKSRDKHVITLASRVLAAPEYKYSVTCALPHFTTW